MLIEWAAWAAMTVAWNAVNSVNSRAKNSASIGYNAASTVISSGLYLASLLLVGNMVLKAHTINAVMTAVVLYAICSAVGSTLGQRWALRFESRNGVVR